jgi:hypothetical protein
MNTADRPLTPSSTPASPAPEREAAADPDALKGAIEGDRPGDRPQQGNANLPALDAEGRPADLKRICEDAVGANTDESTG